MFEGILQPTHLILILAIVLIVFGPGKLPEIGGSLGKSLNEFKRSVSGSPESDAAPTVTPAATQPAAAAVCPTCHTENASGNLFCGKCGEKLG